jgi:hypothetical protein
MAEAPPKHIFVTTRLGLVVIAHPDSWQEISLTQAEASELQKELNEFLKPVDSE